MKIKLSKSQWEFIGKKAGWMKKSQFEEDYSEPYFEPEEDYRAHPEEIVDQETDDRRDPITNMVKDLLSSKNLKDPEFMDIVNDYKDEYNEYNPTKTLDLTKDKFENNLESFVDWILNEHLADIVDLYIENDGGSDIESADWEWKHSR